MLTKDHIVPKGLFLHIDRAAIPQLGVCRDCNNRKSLYDRYLQHFLFVDYQTHAHPVVQELFPKFNAAVKRGRSQLTRHLEGNITSTWIRDAASGMLLPAMAGKLAEDWITPELATITRGLYRFYTHKTLADSTQISVRRVHDYERVLPLAQHWHATGAATYRPVADGEVFNCLYMLDGKKADRSLWFLSFYSRAVFFAETRPA